MTNSTRTAAATVITAKVVRDFFRTDPKRVARLKDEDAAKTVAPGARGRLHPVVIAAYNKGRKPERQYVTGATGKVAEEKRSATIAKRDALRATGVKVSDKGPVPGTVYASKPGPKAKPTPTKAKGKPAATKAKATPAKSAKAKASTKGATETLAAALTPKK